MKPSKTPVALRKEAPSLRPEQDSPTSAPRKGPSNRPRGKKKRPAIVPMMQPVVPALEHLKARAPKMGTR